MDSEILKFLFFQDQLQIIGMSADHLNSIAEQNPDLKKDIKYMIEVNNLKHDEEMLKSKIRGLQKKILEMASKEDPDFTVKTLNTALGR